MLTIGELAGHTGVATSALRYWEELGLLPTSIRVSGQRRYPHSAIALVGIILLLSEVGFSLNEQKALLASQSVAVDEWRRLAMRKLAELDQQIERARAAREAIEHALRCQHKNISHCPTFIKLVDARVAGHPIRQAHAH